MQDPFHQFLIKPLIPIHIGGLDISFTNSAAFMVAATLATIAFIHFGAQRAAVVPGRFQAMVEMVYGFIADMLRENTGKEGMVFFPFVFGIFMFVLLGNLFGMLPYGFTFTSHIIVTFSMAMLIFCIVTGYGLAKHGTKFFSLFFPEGTPIYIAPLLIPVEIISYMIRPITLSLRLFANMVIGHVLLKIIAGFVIMLGIAGLGPLLLNTLLTGFELFVAVIQAYVFTLMTCMYLHDAVHLH
ncbi:MAG: F0F1 ATP synthase subunit A [Alphaproteobacteria bacterium]